MKKALEKIKRICFIDTFLEFSNYLTIKPKKYQALQNLSPKIIIRLESQNFINIYKKNKKNSPNIFSYLDFSFSTVDSTKNKIIFLKSFITPNNEIVKSFSELEKIQFFNLLLDHNLGQTNIFYQLFSQIALQQIEEIASINLVDRYLSNLMEKPLKEFHLALTDQLMSFLLDIIEIKIDLLDDKACLVLLQIAQKLRILNLIIANSHQERKYLKTVENRFINLLNLDNVSNEPEYLSQVMFSFAKLEYFIENQNLVNFFESKVLQKFKTLNAAQIYRALMFLIVYNSKNGMRQKEFLDLFYIKYMHGTDFYLKEYLNRSLNIKKLELNLFKNLGMIFKRFFLSSFRVFEPNYLKTFHFDIFQLGDLYHGFGKIEEFNLSNLMVVLRKNIIERLQLIYEYKMRKNINMEYKLHSFWVKILEYYNFNLQNSAYILDVVESALLYDMSLDYSILNFKLFDLEELMILYGVIKHRKYISHGNEAKKLAILQSFIDEKCSELLKNDLQQQIYLMNNPMIMLMALEEGLRLQEKEMIEMSLIVNIMGEMLKQMKNYENSIILKLLQLMERISFKQEYFEFVKTLLEKIMQDRIVETFFIKDFNILVTSLNLFLELYCYKLQKFDQNYKGGLKNLIDKMSQSINLLIGKLLFIDSTVIDEASLFAILRSLQIIDEHYLRLQHTVIEEFETLYKFCFRFIADRHKKISYQGLEKILNIAFKMDIFSHKFDDGSGLYDKTLMQELDPYLEDNWKMFSEEFRNEWNEKKIKNSTV